MKDWQQKALLHPCENIGRIYRTIMKTKNLGMLLLAIYLIFGGVIGLFGIRLGHLSIVLPLLAISAGVAIIMGK